MTHIWIICNQKKLKVRGDVSHLEVTLLPIKETPTVFFMDLKENVFYDSHWNLLSPHYLWPFSLNDRRRQGRNRTAYGVEIQDIWFSLVLFRLSEGHVVKSSCFPFVFSPTLGFL